MTTTKETIAKLLEELNELKARVVEYSMRFGINKKPQHLSILTKKRKND